MVFVGAEVGNLLGHVLLVAGTDGVLARTELMDEGETQVALSERAGLRRRVDVLRIAGRHAGKP